MTLVRWQGYRWEAAPKRAGRPKATLGLYARRAGEAQKLAEKILGAPVRVRRAVVLGAQG